MRTLFRPVVPAIAAFLSIACSSDTNPGASTRGSGGTAATSGGMTSAGQTTGGATAGTSAQAGTSAGGVIAGGNSSGGAGANAGGNASVAGASNGGTGGNATSGGSAANGGTGGSATSGGSAASGCVGVASKFCDDFEMQTSGMAPKGDFSIDAKAGAIVVDSSKAYSGTQALHITSPKPGAQSFLNFTKQFPLNDFYGRAMFYVSKIPTADIHWDLLDALSQNDEHWEIGGMYGKFILVVDPPDHGLTSNTFPAGKWFCLQWEFKYGGQGMDNTFVAKMDGTVLDKGQFTGADSEGKKWDAGPWKNLSIGWTGYGNSDVDIEEWIDDLALGDQPIACPAAK